VRLQPFLDRRDDEPLLRKNTRNAFTSTDLAERLAVLGVRRIAVTGIQTEQCCETTARVAGEELARNLLNDPRLTVEAVAARCGFETPRQLRRVWKEAFGTTPRAAALQPNA
ncbi:MAG TPA: isochorismatase family protein, partial [Longimicrobium sp.]|nr:isochorismatase family protein [Longimicrobium sp.]